MGYGRSNLILPPIINSQDIGQVHAGDSALLVEVTGTDMRMVLLTLNIFATNLADRGAAIDPIDVQYPYDTGWGQVDQNPCDISDVQKIPLKAIDSALGLPFDAELVQQTCGPMGMKSKRVAIHSRCGYRTIEAISCIRWTWRKTWRSVAGMTLFVPAMPAQFTVGSLSSLEMMSDYIRDHMIGQGFQEIFSNILLSHEELVERMRLPASDQVVEVDNVMSQSFSCLRSGLCLPCCAWRRLRLARFTLIGFLKSVKSRFLT